MDRRRVIAMGLAAAGTGIASPIGAQSAGKSKGRAIITTETLKGAEAIHAVDFPEDALARIAPSMAEQPQAVAAVRAVPRPLDLQPAPRFDPPMTGRIHPTPNHCVRLARRSSSEERSRWNECVSTGRTRWPTIH